MSSPDLTALQLEVLAALVKGASVSAAARSVGLHRTTIHHWVRTVPAFRIMLHDAMQSRAEEIQDKMYELNDSALETIGALLKDSSAPAAVRLRAALKIIETAGTPPPKPQTADVPLASLNAITAQLQTRPAAHQADPVHHNSSVFITKGTNPAVEARPSNRPAPSAPCSCGSGVKFEHCCGWDASAPLPKAG